MLYIELNCRSYSLYCFSSWLNSVALLLLISFRSPCVSYLEQTAGLRRLFLYTTAVCLLLPFIQSNLRALINILRCAATSTLLFYPSSSLFSSLLLFPEFALQIATVVSYSRKMPKGQQSLGWKARLKYVSEYLMSVFLYFFFFHESRSCCKRGLRISSHLIWSSAFFFMHQ